mmetsp:Transcript_132511/g.247827  ORF Transcript_132511/g.247827 Transcript_132511/m.247827 type:complete len:193 (-) Transcript_132511:8-586(-)
MGAGSCKCNCAREGDGLLPNSGKGEVDLEANTAESYSHSDVVQADDRDIFKDPIATTTKIDEEVQIAPVDVPDKRPEPVDEAPKAPTADVIEVEPAPEAKPPAVVVEAESKQPDGEAIKPRRSLADEIEEEYSTTGPGRGEVAIQAADIHQSAESMIPQYDKSERAENTDGEKQETNGQDAGASKKKCCTIL